MFSNAVTQFLDVIKPILSRTWFLAYIPELGYSLKDTNRGCWEHTLLKKTPGMYRYVTWTLKIPDKMKLHLWKFHQIVLQPLECPRPKTKTHGSSTLFFSWSCLEIPLFFLLISAVSRFYFFNPPGNSMSSKPPFAFFWNSPLEVVTASQICKPLIQQSTRFGQRAQIILFKLSFWFYVSPDSPPIMNLQAIA